jgi:hypothetical protein
MTPGWQAKNTLRTPDAGHWAVPPLCPQGGGTASTPDQE